MFLEQLSPGTWYITVNIRRLENKITDVFESEKTKGAKQDSQNQLSLHLSKEGKPIHIFVLIIITLLLAYTFLHLNKGLEL